MSVLSICRSIHAVVVVNCREDEDAVDFFFFLQLQMMGGDGCPSVNPSQAWLFRLGIREWDHRHLSSHSHCRRKYYDNDGYRHPFLSSVAKQVSNLIVKIP